MAILRVWRVPEFLLKKESKKENISREIDDPKIIIPQSYMEFMENLAWSATKNDEETGGYFYGYRDSHKNYVIAHCTGPGDKATKTRVRFIPDADLLQKELDNLNDIYDVNWIGSWHVHPRNLCQLSKIDIDSMIKVVNDPECCNYFLAVVFSAYGDELDYKAFNIEKDQKVIQEFKIQIESDSNIINRLNEDCIKQKVEINEPLQIQKIIEKHGFTNVNYKMIDVCHVFRFVYHDVDVHLFVPIDNKISPCCFVNDKQFPVPINWNYLTLDVGDFIDSFKAEMLKYRKNIHPE